MAVSIQESCRAGRGEAVRQTNGLCTLFLAVPRFHYFLLKLQSERESVVGKTLWMKVCALNPQMFVGISQNYIGYSLEFCNYTLSTKNRILHFTRGFRLNKIFD